MDNKIKVKDLPNIALYTTNENNETTFSFKFSKGSYKGQNELVEYMKSGIIYGAKPEILYDAFSDKPIPYESLVVTDGKYKWTTELLYYVENYNMILPSTFVENALKNKKVTITQEALC